MNNSDATTIPLFVLPAIVLMPGAVLPLHVFEPRYKALLSDVMESDKRLAIATLDPHSTRGEVYPELGIGEVVGLQTDEQSRSNILVAFRTAALFLQEEPTTKPYRVALVQPLATFAVIDERARHDLETMVLQLGGISTEAQAEVNRLLSLPPTVLCDSLASRLLRDSDQRRAYLIEPDWEARMDLIRDLLAGFLLARDPVGFA